MDFFSAQDRARKKTTWLVALFALAVVALVVVTNLFLIFVLNLSGADTLTKPSPEMVHTGFWENLSWDRFLIVGAIVSGVVGIGSLYRTISLSQGGKAVAELLGGSLVAPDAQDLPSRRLLNVVEEMAIASGIPVPQVFVLEGEPGINAFAAGLGTGDAVVAVTRGTLDTLNREELQGVVGHEFSHILNGDMRLNLRLAGVLYGILMIGLIGRFIMRVSLESGSSRKSSKDNGGMALLAVGAGLAILGYVGTLFGNLIKASVSRQREYLADASAVQFTRNPDGIANALKKIGASSQGSVLQTADAAEFSHLYFGDGIKHLIGGLFATHPPLDQRIRSLQPYWDGKFEVTAPRPTPQAQAQATTAGAEPMASMLAASVAMLDQGGLVQPEQISQARNLIDALPERVREAVRQPHDARAIIYAMLIDSKPEIASQQLEQLSENANAETLQSLMPLIDLARDLPKKFRLPLVDLAMPALRQLSHAQYFRFKANLNALIRADGEVKLAEWTLKSAVLGYLQKDFEKARFQRNGSMKIERLRAECALVLSFVAALSEEADQRVSFAAGIAELHLAEGDISYSATPSFVDLDKAVLRLQRLAPLQKPILLKACAAAIAADAKASVDEIELLRGLSALLDCPMPLLPEGVSHA